MRHTLLALAFCGIAALTWAADDPFVGTWKLNLAKSKVAGPVLRSIILKIEPAQNGFRWAFDIVDAEGKVTHSESSGKYNGNDNPIIGDENIDTIASKMEGDTLVSDFKKAGRIMRAGRAVVSNDGKTLTIIEKEGQRTSIEVYDKQ